jgi:membrane protein YqaA with SNARE-associated domain
MPCTAELQALLILELTESNHDWRLLLLLLLLLLLVGAACLMCTSSGSAEEPSASSCCCVLLGCLQRPHLRKMQQHSGLR